MGSTAQEVPPVAGTGPRDDDPVDIAATGPSRRRSAPVERSGGVLTFDEWVAARGPSLVRFAHLITGNLGDAQDAVQDVLVSVYPRWARLQATGTAEAYVRRSIVNRHISVWRSFRRRETPTTQADIDAAGDTATHSAGGAHDLAGAVADADAAWRLCAELSRVQRAAVVLRYYEDQSFAQIGQTLDCTESTARSHVRRALAVLRTRLTEAGERDD